MSWKVTNILTNGFLTLKTLAVIISHTSISLNNKVFCLPALTLFWLLQDVEINEKVDVIVSEWMGYMLLYEVIIQLQALILLNVHNYNFLGHIDWYIFQFYF